MKTYELKSNLGNKKNKSNFLGVVASQAHFTRRRALATGKEEKVECVKTCDWSIGSHPGISLLDDN